MLKSKYLIPFLFLLALLAACHYRPMYIPESGEEGDSARINTRAYALNSNFQVEADTLWLHVLPFMDTVALVQGDEVVVAEFDVQLCPSTRFRALFISLAMPIPCLSSWC